MLERALLPTLRARLAESPAVALIGPRQAGKTTLARSLGGRYYDLEQEGERLRLDLEWPDIERSKGLAILDEAQAAPEVFPRLRGAIDAARRRHGRFLLLGSVSPSLMTEVSQSLAGRLSLLEITPLLLPELETAASRRRTWLVGGFPDGGILSPRAFPRWQDDYLQLLIQRDLPAWGLPARPQTTARFVRMLAATHGQTWNASSLGKSLGLSYHTVNGYLDYLEGAFLVRRLQPYHANLRKRLVKSPKVFWRDSGLLHSMLGVADQLSLLAQPWVGASWEGFVIEQVLGLLTALGRRHRAFHLRTSDGHEIDLVLEVESERWAIEAKLTTSPSPRDLARLDAVADLIGAQRRFLVSQTREVAGNERRGSYDLESFLDFVAGES
ncbi:MAG TPA: ATP-binding protein [Thermoanaerobaculia bacterium]|nr:ATP-binding protein [Thermoanaerobaculia bacterium]